MNHRIFVLVATAAFAGGLTIGHYKLPRGWPVMTSAAKNEAAPRSPNSVSQPRPTAQSDTFESGASFGGSNIVNAIANSAAHPADRNLSSEVRHLIESVDAKDIPAAFDTILSLADQREKDMFLSMLISRWVSIDPTGAGQRALQLAPGPIRDTALQVLIARWCEQSAESAYAWANTLPAGAARDNTLQEVLSRWSSTDPERAASMAVALPAGAVRERAIADI